MPRVCVGRSRPRTLIFEGDVDRSSEIGIDEEEGTSRKEDPVLKLRDLSSFENGGDGAGWKGRADGDVYARKRTKGKCQRKNKESSAENK